MKNSFYIDLQRFMLIPTKFPLTHYNCSLKQDQKCSFGEIALFRYVSVLVSARLADHCPLG